MSIINKTALDHSFKVYNKGFVKRVIDGDGRIFLKHGYKFEIELAFQIGVILDETFGKSFKNVIEDSRINSIWDYDYRFDLVEENPFPVEKLLYPNSDEEIEKLVNDLDYFLSCWEHLSRLKPEKLKKTNNKLRNKLVICHYNDLQDYDQLFLNALFKHIEDHIHYLIRQSIEDLRHAYNKEISKRRNLNGISLFVRKAVLKIFEIESEIKNQSVEEILAKKILEENNIKKRVDQLVFQIVGIIDLYKTGKLPLDLDYYLGVELGASIHNLMEDYLEERQNSVKLAAKLNLDYILGQVIRFYQKLKLPIPKLTDIGSKLYLSVSEGKVNSIDLDISEMRKRINAGQSYNYPKALTKKWALEWVTGKKYYSGMKELLINELREKHKNHHEKSDEPSHSTIKKRIDIFRGDLSFSEWVSKVNSLGYDR